MRNFRASSAQISFQLLLPAIRLPSGVGRKNSRSLHVTRVARPQVAAVDMTERCDILVLNGIWRRDSGRKKCQSCLFWKHTTRAHWIAPQPYGSTCRSIPEGFQSVTEGQATVLSRGNSVFYNRAQVVNRDISSAVIRWYIKQQSGTKKKKKRRHGTAIPPSAEASPLKLSKNGISILEAMSATGLRAIRYAKEIDGIGTVVANDLDKAAVESIQRNVEFNDVQSIVQPHRDDARVLMLQNPAKFDVVDIDPYGAPVELLDSAVQSVKDNGLLMVTATDMAVLCGNHAEACFTKYGSYSLHKDFHHEQAFRILLACIATHAARHKRVIEPVLCMSIDFYIRVFVLVRTSAQDSKLAATKLSHVWHSTGCDAWWFQPVGTHVGGNTNRFHVGKGPAVPPACPISTGKFHMGGPIWNQPTTTPSAVKEILKDLEENSDKYPAHAKLRGMLNCVDEELHDVPLFYTLTGLAKTLRVDTLKFEKFRNALVNAGYRMSGTHCNPNGLKTDAPPEVVWDIMRCWAKQKMVVAKDPTSYQAKILAVEPEHEANFKTASGVYSRARAAGKARFVQNPDNWGPRRRHGRPMMEHEVGEGEEEDKGENTERLTNVPNKRARVEVKPEGTEGGIDTVEAENESAEVQAEAKEGPQGNQELGTVGAEGAAKERENA